MNSGKRFEQLFQDSCKVQGISCTRLRDAGYRGEDTERRFTIHNICDFIVFPGGLRLYFLELKSRKKAIAFKDLEAQAKALTKKYQEAPDLNVCGFLFEFTDPTPEYFWCNIVGYEPFRQAITKKSFNRHDAENNLIPVPLYIPEGKRAKRILLDYVII